MRKEGIFFLGMQRHTRWQCELWGFIKRLACRL